LQKPTSLQHLEIVVGALLQPLRLEQLAARLELGEALVELLLDRVDRRSGGPSA
jgi:hypothetical protein